MDFHIQLVAVDDVYVVCTMYIYIFSSVMALNVLTNYQE